MIKPSSHRPGDIRSPSYSSLGPAGFSSSLVPPWWPMGPNFSKFWAVSHHWTLLLFLPSATSPPFTQFLLHLSLPPNFHPPNLPNTLSSCFNSLMNVHFATPANFPSHCSRQYVASPIGFPDYCSSYTLPADSVLPDFRQTQRPAPPAPACDAALPLPGRNEGPGKRLSPVAAQPLPGTAQGLGRAAEAPGMPRKGTLEDNPTVGKNLCFCFNGPMKGSITL